MTPSLQTLSQSLSHWQAVYIGSIVVALLSTFAIVIFAFHIERHKSGLKVSNYIYVLASLLAVLATILVVNKSKTIDTEKDRLLVIATNDANVRISEATREAKDAEKAAQILEHQNLILQNRLAISEHKQSKVESAIAPRVLVLHIADIKSLAPFAKNQIRVMSSAGDQEASDLSFSIYKKLNLIFDNHVTGAQILGLPPDSPLFKFGVHLFYSSDDQSKALAGVLKDIFSHSSIRADVAPANASVPMKGKSIAANGEVEHLSYGVVIYVGSK